MKSVIVGYVSIRTGKRGSVLNKDVWTFFDKYVPKYFKNTDILLFNNDTLNNLGSDSVIEKLNSYDNIILCGREPLKVLGLEDAYLDLNNTKNEIVVDSEDEDEENNAVDPDDEDSESSDEDDEEKELDQEAKTNKKDSRIDSMRYYGLLNSNEKLKFKKIHVVYSLMYYISKDRINVFYFDILNRTDSNEFIPAMVNVNPKFHHISELRRVFDEQWTHEDDLGFDYESRGFPYDHNFRLLGFSLSNDKYQAYFYFSRDDQKYLKEMIDYSEDLKYVLKDRADKLWAFNNKFENNATHHALNERVFYQDTRVFTQMMKTRGGLKFSANLFLNIPMWNDEINVFMKNYKLFVKWMQTVKVVLNTDTFVDVSSEVIEESEGDLSLINAVYNFNYDEAFEYNMIYDKSTKTLTIKKLSSSECFRNNAPLFFKTVMELIRNGDEVFSFFFNHKDQYVEGNFNLLELLNGYFNEYNEWQVTPIGGMGYYCILDGYYTLKLKEMLYDTNFHGVRDGYQFYISQTNHASLIESNGVHLNLERFNEWQDWVLKEIDIHAKWIALFPAVKDEVVKSLYQRTYTNNLKVQFTEYMSLYMKTKRGFDKLLNFLVNFDSKDIKAINKSKNSKMYENRQKINSLAQEGTKLTKAQYKKQLQVGFSTDETILYELLDLTNKKIIVGLEGFEEDQRLEMFIDHFMKKHKEYSDLAIEANSLEAEEERYIKRVEESNYDKLNDLLGFSSNKDSVRQLFSRILVQGDYGLTILRIIFIRTLSTTTFTDVDRVKKMSLEELMKFLNDFVNAKIINENVKAVQSSLLTAKKFVDRISTGEKFDRDTLRVAAQGYHQYIGRNEENYNKFTNTLNYENSDDYMKFIYHFQLMKRCIKSISTLIKGSLGKGSTVRTSSPTSLVKDPNGTNLLYRTAYWQNDKDTLRWSSAWHTIPPENDFSLCYTPREDNKLFFHMDRA
jgi:hypothetical protein